MRWWSWLQQTAWGIINTYCLAVSASDVIDATNVVWGKYSVPTASTLSITASDWPSTDSHNDRPNVEQCSHQMLYYLNIAPAFIDVQKRQVGGGWLRASNWSLYGGRHPVRKLVFKGYIGGTYYQGVALELTLDIRKSARTAWALINISPTIFKNSVIAYKCHKNDNNVLMRYSTGT